MTVWANGPWTQVGAGLTSPHRISRRLPLRQAQGTGSASATPPQGGSDARCTETEGGA